MPAAPPPLIPEAPLEVSPPAPLPLAPLPPAPLPAVPLPAPAVENDPAELVLPPLGETFELPAEAPLPPPVWLVPPDGESPTDPSLEAEQAASPTHSTSDEHKVLHAVDIRFLEGDRCCTDGSSAASPCSRGGVRVSLLRFFGPWAPRRRNHARRGG